MMRMIRPALLLACALLCACSTPGYRGLWQPKPSEALVTGADGVPAARVSTSVLGLWRGEPYDGELHVRFLVQGLNGSPLNVPLDRIALLTGDLRPCTDPRLVGGENREVRPGDSVSFDVSFYPPVEEGDITGLQLQWIVLLDGHEVPGSTSFQYIETYYDGWGYPMYVGVGYSYGYWYGDPWCWGGGGWGGSMGGVTTLPPHSTSMPGR
jgi:hypothetical protein